VVLVEGASRRVDGIDDHEPRSCHLAGGDRLAEGLGQLQPAESSTLTTDVDREAGQQDHADRISRAPRTSAGGASTRCTEPMVRLK